MQHLKPVTCALALLLLAACATMGARGFEALPLLPPAAFGAEASNVQRLTLSRESGGQKLALDAAVEVDANELRVAGMLLGQRILLLDWDGKALQEQREPVVPKALDGRAILRDLQLVYWPAAAIRAALPQGWRLEEKAARRQLFRGSRLVFESERGDAAPLGNARLWNRIGQYRIDIEAAK
ncbi:MAG: DUF3261 domain-containing protein [Pseudomonadota bacterium]